jgi:hypothetical protein
MLPGLFPNWLLQLHPEMPNAARTIEETKAFLIDKCKEPHVYPRLGQRQASEVYGELMRLGMIVRNEKGEFAPTLDKSKTATIDQNKIRIGVYNWAQAYHQLKAYNFAKKAICLKLLDGIAFGMNSKNLLIAAPSMRCVIEHAGQFHLLMLNLQEIFDQAENADLPTLWTRYSGEITKRAYATRIDWIKVTLADFKKDKAKSFEYKKSEYFADMEAADLLKGVDKLEKRVTGVRLAYDVLCEFTHPNYGTIYAVTENAEVQKDNHGIDWQMRKLGLGSPGFLIDIAKEILIDTFLVFAEVVGSLKGMIVESGSLEKKVLKNIQEIMRKTLEIHPNLFARSVSCPCGSGIKVKKCCGSVPARENVDMSRPL